jgi:hypothetical protein
MPAEPLDPPQPRPSYRTCMLLPNVLKILPADARLAWISASRAQAVKGASAPVTGA